MRSKTENIATSCKTSEEFFKVGKRENSNGIVMTEVKRRGEVVKKKTCAK